MPYLVSVLDNFWSSLKNILKIGETFKVTHIVEQKKCYKILGCLNIDIYRQGLYSLLQLYISLLMMLLWPLNLFYSIVFYPYSFTKFNQNGPLTREISSSWKYALTTVGKLV